MKRNFIYLYILVLFANSQIVFAQSNSEGFSHITNTPGELIVRLHSDTSVVSLDRLSKRLGAVSISPIFSPATPAGQHPRLKNIYLIRFPAQWALEPLLQRYENHSAIEAVELNRLSQPFAGTVPNDPGYSEQWNLRLINMPEAWGIAQGSPQVTVAVVDSGIVTRHPEFRSQLWRNSGEIPENGIDDDGNGYVDDINGWDFSDAPTLPGSGDSTGRDNEPEDETGHGTHVSGIIAAETNNGIGIAGIARQCRLMPLRAGFKFGGGEYLQNDDLAAAIVYAADNGARVINMSWGDTVNALVIEDALAYAYARGCVLVGAAGNSGALGSYYPAALKTVISVAGLGQEKQLYSDSNFGATVDIAAPGEEIPSTDIDGSYQNRSGTSMAAAHVSGVAALVVAANPNWTVREVMETVTGTATPLFINPLVGAGALDAYAALTVSSGVVARIDNLGRTSLEERWDGGWDDWNVPSTTLVRNIEIFGSAGGPGFTAYWLEYGVGEVPEVWIPLGSARTKPVFNACLYKEGVAGLVEEGHYTIRLTVQTENGAIKRDRTVVEIYASSPTIRRHEAQQWLAGERLDWVVMWETAAVTIGALEIWEHKPLNESELHFQTDLKRISYSDAENRLHIVNVSDLGVPPGTYHYKVSATNRAKFDESSPWNDPFEVRDSAIPLLSLSETLSAEQGLHIIATSADMNSNSRLEFIAVDMDAGLAGIYEGQANGTFESVFAFTESFWPWGVSDTDGDGLMEILCQALDTIFLLEQPAPGEFPTERIWEAVGKWSRTIVDADADGRDEIFARDNATNTIVVYESAGDNNHRTVAVLENPTLGNNGLSANFVASDADGDGRIEILAGDSDGDLFIHEAAGNDQYRQTWVSTFPYEGPPTEPHQRRQEDTLSIGVPELFAAGDLDGDGKAEFAVCARTGTEIAGVPLDIRYHHWLLTIFTSVGDDTYRPVWQRRIRDIRDSGSGMTIADANHDGQKELCLVVPPNFYLIQHDGKDYRPIGYHSGATSTFNPTVTDINGDGVKMLLFNTDKGLAVFENFSSHPDQPVTVPSEVAAKPKGRPLLLRATYSPPNQLLLTFDRPLGLSATQTGLYRLYKEINHLSPNMSTGAGDFGRGGEREQLHYPPTSAILDRSGTRVVLTFAPSVFRTGHHYFLRVMIDVSNTDGTEVADNFQELEIVLPTATLPEVIVYPNPVTCGEVTFDKLPRDTSITIYDVAGNLTASFERTDRENDRILWNLQGISSGVYVYVLEAAGERRVGKLSVIR